MKSFQAHLDDRDFQAAVTLLELETAAEESKVTNGDEWLAYAAFHLGNHELVSMQPTHPPKTTLDVRPPCRLTQCVALLPHHFPG